MIGPCTFAAAATLLPSGPGDLIGLRVEHHVENLGHLLGSQTIQLGFGHVLVDLHDAPIGRGLAPSSNRGFSC